MCRLWRVGKSRVGFASRASHTTVRCSRRRRCCPFSLARAFLFVCFEVFAVPLLISAMWQTKARRRGLHDVKLVSAALRNVCLGVSIYVKPALEVLYAFSMLVSRIASGCAVASVVTCCSHSCTCTHLHASFSGCASLVAEPCRVSARLFWRSLGFGIMFRGVVLLALAAAAAQADVAESPLSGFVVSFRCPQ